MAAALPEGITLGPGTPSSYDGTTYVVLRDDAPIGAVFSARVRASVPTGRGGRLRRDIGRPLRWGYRIDSNDGNGPHYTRARWTTRRAAIDALTEAAR